MDAWRTVDSSTRHLRAHYAAPLHIYRCATTRTRTLPRTLQAYRCAHYFQFCMWTGRNSLAFGHGFIDSSRTRLCRSTHAARTRRTAPAGAFDVITPPPPPPATYPPHYNAYIPAHSPHVRYPAHLPAATSTTPRCACRVPTWRHFHRGSCYPSSAAWRNAVGLPCISPLPHLSLAHGILHAAFTIPPTKF